MGIIAIEWCKEVIDATEDAVDLKPVSEANASFVVDSTTTASSSDIGTAPAGTVYALVSSVDVGHYVRNGTAASSTTGGRYVPPGGSRVIDCAEGDVIKAATVS